MKVLKPAALKKGDRVGLIAAASRPESSLVLNRCRKIVEDMGFVPVVGRHVLNVNGSLAGLDSERMEDLNSFLLDNSIKGIFCLTGGWGSLRLLPFIDFKHVREHPKVLIGGDDNSSLLLAINKLTGLIVFNGLNLDQIKSKDTFENYRDSLMKVDTWESINYTPGPAINGVPYASDYRDAAEGIICSSNLTALMSLLGTPYQPELKDRLLILEDINERHDILDRWFTSLYLSGILQKTAGIGFGHFDNCNNKGFDHLLSFEDTFQDRLKMLKIPFCFGLPFGQSSPTSVLPIGIPGRLDFARHSLDFIENALL